MSSKTETFSERLLRARLRLGYTHDSLAQKAGASAKSVSRYEKGAKPQERLYAPLADALGVRVEWLRDGEGPMVAPPFYVEVGPEGGIQPGASSIARRAAEEHAQKKGAHILHTSEGAQHIPPHLLERAIVQPRVNHSLQPEGDGILADRLDVELRVGTAAVLRTEMPTDAFEGRIERGAQIEVVPAASYCGAGIYFLKIDGRDDVARVQALPGNAYRLSYDNPAYPSFVLVPSEADGRYVEPESGLAATLEFLGRIEGSHRRH